MKLVHVSKGNFFDENGTVYSVKIKIELTEKELNFLNKAFYAYIQEKNPIFLYTLKLCQKNPKEAFLFGINFSYIFMTKFFLNYFQIENTAYFLSENVIFDIVKIKEKKEIKKKKVEEQTNNEIRIFTKERLSVIFGIIKEKNDFKFEIYELIDNSFLIIFNQFVSMKKIEEGLIDVFSYLNLNYMKFKQDYSIKLTNVSKTVCLIQKK